MQRVIAYVDGFNLYHGIRARHGRAFHWLNLEALVGCLLRDGQRLDRVRYFTARVRDHDDGRLRQTAYLEALRAHCARLEILEGRFQRKSCACRACHAQWITYEEKESDVHLAVSLVEDAARNTFDTALIISADSDLCPAVRAAKRLQPARKIIAVFPPARHSDDLRRSADGLLRIDRPMLRRSQLPSTVMTAGGVVLERPSYWK